MKDFLNEIIRLWWVEGGTELKNPKSEASIKALRVVLKEDLEFSNDVIEYIVENIKTSITHFASEPQSSGINVGKNQSAVSAQLHPDWDDEDLNEDDEEEAEEPENDKEKVDADIKQNALTAYEKDKLKEMSFKMRLGIHTGPVVAGIVGVKKFQYDIWGDTVNTAARMESSGVVGKVNISQTTYGLLKEDNDFSFENRGKIKAKGKGEMEMFFVSKS